MAKVVEKGNQSKTGKLPLEANLEVLFLHYISVVHVLMKFCVVFLFYIYL